MVDHHPGTGNVRGRTGGQAVDKEAEEAEEAEKKEAEGYPALPPFPPLPPQFFRQCAGSGPDQFESLIAAC